MAVFKTFYTKLVLHTCTCHSGNVVCVCIQAIVVQGQGKNQFSHYFYENINVLKFSYNNDVTQSQ